MYLTIIVNRNRGKLPRESPPPSFIRWISAQASRPVTILSANFCTSRLACCKQQNSYLIKTEYFSLDNEQAATVKNSETRNKKLKQ